MAKESEDAEHCRPASSGSHCDMVNFPLSMPLAQAVRAFPTCDEARVRHERENRYPQLTASQG